MKAIKAFFQSVLWILIAACAVCVLLITFLTVTEYQPEDVEKAEVTGTAKGKTIPTGEPLTILSWNLGYAGLSREADFAMDGGGNTWRADRETVLRNLRGISDVLEREEPALMLLQEADSRSSRTYGEDFRKWFALAQNAFALNYSCPFVPWPRQIMGRINSGLLTASDYDVAEAVRISLPCPFSWPVRTINLKRCLLVSRLPVEGSDKELVLINLHLEAYDNGEGKIAQMLQLKGLMRSEYEKGNYVIATGDFNQVFPGGEEAYPNTHRENWNVGELEQDSIPEGFSYAYDLETPSCRLLNQPYDPSDSINTQYYVIDGAILSPNVELREVKTLDEGFAFSDHNPVRFTVILSRS